MGGAQRYQLSFLLSQELRPAGRAVASSSICSPRDRNHRYAESSDYTREALFVLIEQQKGMQRILEEWGPCFQIAQKGELTCVVSLRGGCVCGSCQFNGM